MGLRSHWRTWRLDGRAIGSGSCVSFSQFAADAEPMPPILVIAAGASEVEQNSAETGLSEIELHKCSGRWLCRFVFSYAGRKHEPTASSPNRSALKTHWCRARREAGSRCAFYEIGEASMMGFSFSCEAVVMKRRSSAARLGPSDLEANRPGGLNSTAQG